MPSETKSQNATRVSLAVAHSFKVDAKSGRLTDLVLMGLNREAEGHGMYLDHKTGQTALEAAQKRGGRIKGYRTHDHRGPGGWSREEGSELDIIGYFSGIELNGSALTAAQFKFFESFKKAQPEAYERLIEMAQETPDLISLSVEISGYLVFVTESGQEYSERPRDVPLRYDGMPVMRITDLYAAAFVAEGAATDGLFARFAAMFGAKQSGDADFMAKLRAFFGREDPANRAALHSGGNSEKQSAPDLMQKTQEAIRAKFGAHPADFDAASLILAHNPDWSIEQVEAKLGADRTAAFQAEHAKLKGEHTALKADLEKANNELASLKASHATEVANLKAEKAALQAQYEALKTSGAAPVGLGATGAGGQAENPWLEGQVNLTKQVELKKSNPALAAQLEAAAKEAKK